MALEENTKIPEEKILSQHPDNQINTAKSESKSELPVRFEKPLQNNFNSSFNLKNLFDKVEEEAMEMEEDLENKPKDDFTKADLLAAWDAFLETLREQGKVAEFNAFKTGTVDLKENHSICFTFKTASLYNEFKLHRDALMKFFRKRFNNYHIDLNVDINEEELKKHFKSNAEIFKEMAQKNPILLQMKKDFGLDYDVED